MESSYNGIQWKRAGKGHILFLDQTTKGTLEAKMGEGHTGAIWGKCCSK